MNLISHAATILPVREMENSLRFYTEILGFTPTYLHDDPVSYAVLKLGEISIHLSLTDKSIQSGVPQLYFFVHDVDQIHDRIKESYDGQSEEPTLWDYGMRDFEVTDPNGHRLIFGKHKDQD